MTFFRAIFGKKEKKIEKEEEQINDEEFQDCADPTLEDLLALRTQRKEMQMDQTAENIANWVLNYLENNAENVRRLVAQNCFGHASVIHKLNAPVENCRKHWVKISQRTRKFLFQHREFIGQCLKSKEDVVCKVDLIDSTNDVVTFDLYFIFLREMYPGNAQKSLPRHVFRIQCFESKGCPYDDDSSDNEESYDCHCVVYCKKCQGFTRK